MSEATETVDGRESTYGHPWDDFIHVQAMMKIWERRRNNAVPELDTDYEDCVRHVVYMMMVKLGRLAQTPNHRDSIVDLGGYAECLLRCHKRAFGKDTAMFKKTWDDPASNPLEDWKETIRKIQEDEARLCNASFGRLAPTPP